MNNNLIRIDVFFYEGTTASGKNYKVPHTTFLGFNMTVQLNGNMTIKKDIQWDAQNNTYYIVYDPSKAGVKINEKGYLILHITD